MPSLSSPDTEELLRRIGGGDRSATSLLLDRHRDRLRRMVAVRVDPRLAARVDPSDVVQDVLFEAAAKLPEYARQRPLPFYPWLRQLGWDRIRELYAQHVRAQRRSVRREQPALPDRSAEMLIRQLVDTGTQASQRVLKDELCQRVLTVLATLDPRDREVLVMRHLEQMALDEVAAALSISVGAVKMRRLRAVQRLRKALDGEYEDDQ